MLEFTWEKMINVITYLVATRVIKFPLSESKKCAALVFVELLGVLSSLIMLG
jgi:hypothetical protein